MTKESSGIIERKIQVKAISSVPGFAEASG
jgi:hypothetical protein